jgi:hypothetical protein
MKFTADVAGTNADDMPLPGPRIDVLFDAGVDHGTILDA